MLSSITSKPIFHDHNATHALIYSIHTMAIGVLQMLKKQSI